MVELLTEDFKSFLWGSCGSILVILLSYLANRYYFRETDEKDVEIKFLGVSERSPPRTPAIRPFKISNSEETLDGVPPHSSISLSTLMITADKELEHTPDVAPPLHLSTTFEPNTEGLVYSRAEQVTRKRVERLLGDLEGGKAVLYSSGMGAISAALLLFRPSRVAFSGGYHQTKQLLRHLQKLYSMELISLSEPLQKGDVVFLESPSNPTCLLSNIPTIVSQAHAVGAYVIVDSTFATPLLQTPLKDGVDVVVHSCTKALGGHSDLLAGVCIVREDSHYLTLRSQRMTYGNIPGNLETWLLLRSLRTLTLRVNRQSRTAAKIVQFLSSHPKVTRVWHPLVPSHPSHELFGALRGAPSCFSIEVVDAATALRLTKTLRLFTAATSLGGSESLVDYRHSYDSSVSPSLLRLSIGLESPTDLIADLRAALDAVE